MSNSRAFRKGVVDSVPIFIAYFAVSLSLGINCTKVGLNWIQSGLMSLLNTTSAGEFAALKVMADNGSYFEIGLCQLVINLRYLLMSASLTIKFSNDSKIGERLLAALGITDEIYGLTLYRNPPLNPIYLFGAFCMACPGWTLGTIIGALAGNVFSSELVSALSFGLYALFIEIIIPASKRNLKLFIICLIAALLSLFASMYISKLSFGLRVVIISVVLSSVFSLVFPVEKDMK